MPKSDRITLHPVTFTAATSTLLGGNPMKLAHISLAFAIASSAIVPFTLSAQAGAAQKAPPAAAQKAPAASSATDQAKCKDGTMYSGTSRQGACSSHGGVAQWLTASKSGAPPKGATAKCNDGTYYTKAERKGACTGHKGVAEWLKKG